GDLDEERMEADQRFSARSKSRQQDKIVRTALMRAEEESGQDIETLPVGQVIQVFSLFSEVQDEAGVSRLCVVRKTMAKLRDTGIVVGDRVRFRDATPPEDQRDAEETRQPEGVIEQVLPRQTVLTRADSFKGDTQHPIVANAQRMLIVASVVRPAVKWGLVDRMIVAAQGGGLEPVVCLNKVDLTGADGAARRALDVAREALAHYRSLGVWAIEASAERGTGIGDVREVLRGRTTVLAGHSGVGKSSLIRAVQPGLDIRVGDISNYTNKGRHTTTSARRYPLDFGGAVVDTPGVKLFGLWGVTRENLPRFFPDVESGAAPEWRRESFGRILESLPGEDMRGEGQGARGK
ncbi:MAG: ribosome small subunit-dependent GTPase A, partial [Tepidisphaeraceae bacterium]